MQAFSSHSVETQQNQMFAVSCYNKGAVEWNKSSIGFGKSCSLNIVAMTTSDLSLNYIKYIKSDVIAYLYLVFVGIFKLGFSGKFHLSLLLGRYICDGNPWEMTKPKLIALIRLILISLFLFYAKLSGNCTEVWKIMDFSKPNIFTDQENSC